MSKRILGLSLGLTLLLTSCGHSSGDRNGAELYTYIGCSSCHGATGTGGSLGPPLKGIGQYWDRESMTNFLVDPKETLASDPRLSKLDDAFKTDMRPFSELTRDQLERIADFVLSLER